MNAAPVGLSGSISAAETIGCVRLRRLLGIDASLDWRNAVPQLSQVSATPVPSTLPPTPTPTPPPAASASPLPGLPAANAEFDALIDQLPSVEVLGRELQYGAQVLLPFLPVP